MSAGLVKAVPPALRNDPGLLFSRIQYARRVGRRLRGGGHAEPRAARSRRGRQSGAMVERAEDGRSARCSTSTSRDLRSKSATRLSGLIRPRLKSTRPSTPAGSPCASLMTLLRPLSALRSPPRPPKIPCPSPEPPIGRGEPPRPWAIPMRPRVSTRAPPACRSPITASSPPNALGRPVSRCARRWPRRPRAIGATRRSARSRRSMATGLTISRRRWRSTPLGNGVMSAQLAAMAEVVKQRDDTGTQVQFAKIAVMQGHPLEAMAFPAVGMPAFVPLPGSTDLPTVYAVARQESEFIWHALRGPAPRVSCRCCRRPRS